MPVETGIIIRTLNEEKWVGEVLRRLAKQTYQNFEIIVVDSGSTDKTLKIVREFPVKLVHIDPESFSYPVALNIGCSNSEATKYFVILSAHSLPLSDTWLAEGLTNFERKDVAGVYGIMEGLPDASIWERIFYNRPLIALVRRMKPKIVFKKLVPGILGFTNAIVRRDLWEEHEFDERYGVGGEDRAWAGYWLERGYVVIMDSRFWVAHSHGLGLISLIRQFKYWAKICKPYPFSREKISFRK